MKAKKVEAPYVGIRPFEKDDWPVFFGRESLSNELLYRLETNRFVAVVGSSGSGKSSVVKAGLLPLLQDHKVMRRAEEWITVICRPGDDPCGSLARRLVAADHRMKDNSDTKQMSVAADLMRAVLRTSDRGIIPVLEGFELPATTHILIVVDQFEELFGFREAAVSDPKAPEEAERFVTCILDSCKEPIQPLSSNLPANLAQRIWVVLTMRSDFIGHCEIFPALSKKVSESQFLVPVLDPEQKRKAIIRPSLATEIEAATYSPFTFDDGLVSIIVNESGTRIDQLPLMQHALMRTWTIAARRAKEGDAETIRLTEKDYDSIGRINKALSEHADAAFAELTHDDRDGRKAAIARRLFLLLCDVSPEGKITRRRPTVDEVMKVAQASVNEVKTIVEAFQRDNRNFIVIRPTGEFTQNTRLDVSHEALLRQWGMLNSSEAPALEAPVAPEVNSNKARPNRLWRSLQKWLLIHTGQQRNSDMARAARGWLAEERDAATELLRLRQDCELHAQGRGDLLDNIDLARVAEWQERNRPSEDWAQRYLDGKGTWKCIEDFISDSRASVSLIRRLSWGLLALFVICLGWAAIYSNFKAKQAKANATVAIAATKTAHDRAKNLQAANDLVEELRKAWDQRRDDQIALAKRAPQAVALKTVDAMRHYVNALRADRSSVEAARFVCKSLAEDPWLRPLTPNITAPPGVPLLCAAIGPDKKIYAVTRDGMLLVRKEGEPEFEVKQPLLPSQLVSPVLSSAFDKSRAPKSPTSNDERTSNARSSNIQQQSAKQPRDTGGINLDPDFAKNVPRIAFLTASFSDDAKHLAVFHVPDLKSKNSKDRPLTCQIWEWTENRYDPVGVVQVTDRAPFHNVTWLPDGQGFMVTRWDAPSCVLYRLESGMYDYSSRGRHQFLKKAIQAAGFGDDGKTIATVIADRPNEISMFDASTAASLPKKTLRLDNPLPGKANQLLSGPGLNELTVVSWSPQPLRIINVLTGKESRGFALNRGDQVMRAVMSPMGSTGSRRIALSMGGRVEVYSERDLSRIGEPIKFKGSIGFSAFSADGKSLLTWSGPTWGNFTVVRLWSLEVAETAEWKDDDFKEIAPPWLPDLADAVIGQGGSSDDDGDLYPERRTLEEFAEKYRNEKIAPEYRPLWNRFFDSTGRPKQGCMADVLTASARPPREHHR